MTTDFSQLLANQNYSEVYKLIKSQAQGGKIYSIWTQIYDGLKYEEIERKMDLGDFEQETKEAVKFYIQLSESNWDKNLLGEFRKVIKMMIAETGSDLRNASHSIVNGKVSYINNSNVNPDLRNSLQELIEHFDKKELYESKADLARVKAQLTLTLNLDKTQMGADMIQYGKSYENVKQFDDSIEIYNGVICDFEDALNRTYENKEMQALELGFLKEAYEGIFRLTKDPAIPQKLKALKLIQSAHQSSAKGTKAQREDSELKKSWFKKLFNS